MDQETFDQMALTPEKLGDAQLFLTEGLIIKVDKFNGNPIGIQLPEKVELKVAYTEPGARGNTASGAVTFRSQLVTSWNQ